MMTKGRLKNVSMSQLYEPDFKLVFESVPGLYLILSPDFTIVAVSDAYLDATMTKRDKILGRNIFHVFPDNPDDPAATGVHNLRASLNHVLENALPHAMAVQKYDIRRPDGSFEERFWSPVNKPIFNGKKEVSYILHRVEDVTEFMWLKNEELKQTKISENLKDRVEEMDVEIFKRAQEIQEINRRLSESEQQIQTIFDSAPDAIVTIDQEGKIRKWNPMAETLFGWKLQEVTGKLLSDTIIPHRYREAHKKGLETFFKTGEGPVLNKTIEIHALKKNNIEFDIALRISPAFVNNKYLFIGFIRDITDRKKAEEKFKALLDSAPDAMVVVNSKGEIVLINIQTEKIFGYNRDELLGQKVEVLIPDRYTDKHLHHREGFFTSARMRNMGAGLQLFGKKKDGTEFPVEISLSPLATEEGLLVSAAIRDIAEKKQMEDQIREANINLEKKVLMRTAELESKNKELEQFAYVASHDLREPLTTTSGFIELFRKKYTGNLDQDADKMLDYILLANERMKVLIQDLLDYSRIGRKTELLIRF